MVEFELADDLLDSEEIVAKVTKFLEEGCKCSQGVKGGYCSRQFQNIRLKGQTFPGPKKSRVTKLC